jgi:hypothetical protein
MTRLVVLLGLLLLGACAYDIPGDAPYQQFAHRMN